MKFNIRLTQPVETQFASVEASDVAEAACSFLESQIHQALFVRPENAGRQDGQTTYFGLVDVQDHGVMCARYFYAGIGRKGGIKVRNPNERNSIAEVEKEFGIGAGSLDDCDWSGEESTDDAWERKMCEANLKILRTASVNHHKE